LFLVFSFWFLVIITRKAFLFPETLPITNIQQPASFSGRKGKGAGLICQLENRGFYEVGKRG
jgi:hypothetical protein